MKNFILFLSLFSLLVINTESKAQPYYYNSGIPTLFENWGNIPGGTGAHPSSFGENTEYIIESGKTAAIDFQWFIDGFATLRINTGGTLQVNHTVNVGVNAKFQIDSAGTCIYNSTTIPKTTLFGGTEIFHSYSSFKIKNWPGPNEPVRDSVSITGGFNDSHVFGNLELDWEGLNGNWFINSIGSLAPLLVCANDFRITSSGKGKIIIPTKNHPYPSYFSAKNYIQTDGEVDLALSSQVISDYAGILQVYGNFQKTGGVIDASSANASGKIEIRYHQDRSSPSYSPQDTAYMIFQNSGILRNTTYEIYNCRLRLQSNMPSVSIQPACSLVVVAATFDCNNYKVTGNSEIELRTSIIKLRSPEGFKNGSSGGDFPISGKKGLYNATFEYCGSSPQITGDSLPGDLKDNVSLSLLHNHLVINNSNGVTLSKDTRMGQYSYLKFIQGKLNLGSHSLKIAVPDSIKGVNENCFINTNGTGCLRIGLDGGYTAKFPIGNGTFSPAYINQAYTGNTDTIAIRIENSFGSHAPFDTSRCVRKVWRVFDENPSVPTGFRFLVQFMKSDAGSNIDYNSTCAVGQYETGYNGYHPWTGSIQEPFITPPDSTIAKTIYSGISFSTTGDDYFVAGNEEGLFEKYIPDNSGDASQLGNWTSLNGLHPASFDRYAIFSVPSGQTASFNNSTIFSDKTILRADGNGVINGNQIVYLNGDFLLNDSSTFNYNNAGVLYDTYFAGRPILSAQSTVKILKWSDTTDKLFQYKQDFGFIRYGNLVINFDNLPNSIGGKWTTVKYPLGVYDATPVRGNLTYIQSSGFEFSPVGYGNRFRGIEIGGTLQLGDSTNFPDAYPRLNLSGGTTKASDTLAGQLYIGKNLDIQNGSIFSQDFPVVARGRIVFRNSGGAPSSHTFYCYNSFLWPTYYIGSPAFPNIIDNSDTLILKSDMYRSQQAAFLFTDAWQVNSGAVLNIDTFRIRSLNLIVKNGGKFITKNRDGFNIDAANQTVTFEPTSILEFAGNTAQNFQKAGAYNLTSFPNITINNPAGVTVNTADINISNSINFINGKVISNNTNYLSFPDEIQFNGATNNSFLNGPVRVNTTSTGVKTIPIGKGNVNRGLVIVPSSASPTDWTVEYFNQQQTYGSTLGSGLTSISSAEYYLINKSGSSNAIIGLFWGPNSGVSEPNNLRVARWNDFQWEDKGNGGFIGDPTGGAVFSNMITDFSPFAIGSVDNQELPVELSSFTSSTDKNNVTLNWTCENEVNNSGFDVERKSASDSAWKKINFVNGAGNSNVRKSYKSADRNLSTGIYSYRIKQIDYNGNFHYFTLNGSINVGIPKTFSLSQNYPNPFNPTTKINFDLPENVKVSIIIFDITGREMGLVINNENFNAGYHTVQFNASAFSSGTYFYRIAAGNYVQTKKMVLVK